MTDQIMTCSQCGRDWAHEKLPPLSDGETFTCCEGGFSIKLTVALIDRAFVASCDKALSHDAMPWGQEPQKS